MSEVIFDSSFLMSVAERPTQWMSDLTVIFGKFEPVILDCAKAELQMLASGRGKRAGLARLALQLAKNFRVDECGKGRVDDEIVSAAVARHIVVATTDGGLIASLKAVGVEVVRLRSGRVTIA